jgi:cell division protein FtsL
MPYSSERYPVSTDIDDNKNKIREDLSKRKDEWDKRVSENGYAEKILKKDISNTASEPKEPAPKKTPAVKSA